MLGVAAESAKRMLGLSGDCWVLKFRVNVGKLQKVFL